MEEKKNRLEPVQLDSCKPLREVVLESLREAIKNEILEPGERLMEIQLADALGVSRTPIREALRKLELEGFIVMVPRKGAYVADISLKDITDIMEIRLALEELAAGLAADRITEEELEQMECSLVEKREAISQGDMERLVEVDTQFHEALYQASRNERLVAMLNNLREQIQRFRIAIFTAPMSLCIVGYFSSFEQKSPMLIYVMLAIALASYLYVTVMMFSLLKIKFYPTYAAFTFPYVISAIAFRLGNAFLVERGIMFFAPIALISMYLAVAVVLYVLVRYVMYFRYWLKF